MSKIQKTGQRTYFYKQFDLTLIAKQQKYEILDFYNFQNTKAYTLIRKSLLRERHQKLMVGIVVLLFGVALVSRLPFKPNEWFLGILMVVSLVVSLLILVNLKRNWQLEQMELIRLLKFEPQKIVWVYHLETHRLPFGIQFGYDCTLYFKLINRDFIEIKLPKSEIKKVSAQLNPLLPHATFGYSIDNAQWYAASPELLLK